MISFLAAKRRKTIATAFGRGFELLSLKSRVAAKESFAAMRLTRTEIKTTAFGAVAQRGLSNIPLHFKGGVDARSIKTPRGLLSRADGVVISKPRSAPCFLEVTNHPGCALKERDHFINGAATPPLKGGE
jgi:hypothetical protein